LAGEIEHKRSDLERFLLVVGYRADGFRLEQYQLIRPRIDLNACPDRQRRRDFNRGL
jgi:hypothetical protein